MSFVLGLLLGFPAIPLATENPANESGKNAEATECVACHSLRLIHSQRLSAAAWAKEVDKMIGWGAPVRDRQALIDYLAAEYSNSKVIPNPVTSGDGAKQSK
jgi:mono/diheme cytochrome c family protein